MLRTIVMMDLPIDDIANMERWYYREHSSEISRRYGPWLERHESFTALNAPADAQRYGFYNWRITECPPMGPWAAYGYGPVATVKDFLALSFEQVGLEWEKYVRFDERYIRPTEVDALIGDASKAREKLGWKPRVGFAELVRMMYENDLTAERVKAGQ